MVDRLISNKKNKVKRLSSSLTSSTAASLISITSACANSNHINANVHYYPSAYITKPCDQLFGPQPLELCAVNLSNSSINDDDKSVNTSLLNTSLNDKENKNDNSFNTSDKFEYIPAPKWNKIQNSILEELFKKSRYPKSTELKLIAQRLHVMDSDIEEWFRRRRGRDRKTRRKNEALKHLIDSYLDK